ncbi:MAG: hypothetical protein ABI068_09260, partial [Ktedonobacterales bacterium]
GVQNATGWAENAVAAGARRNAGLQRAIADGRIDVGIQRTGDQGWKTATVAKGVPAWTANTPKAAAKYQAGMQRVYGYLQAAQQATAGMDTTTVEGRIAKAAAWQRVVSEQAQAAKAGR